MPEVDGVGLLQGVLVLFSAFLVLSQLVMRALRRSETELGRWATNSIIGAIVALWAFLLNSIVRISDYIIENSDGSAAIESALHSLIAFVALTALLLVQYLRYSVDADTDDSWRVWKDTFWRLAIAVGFIIGLSNISIQPLF